MDSGNDLLSEHLRSRNHVGVNQNNDAARLREYLLKGRFLWVDDFWGTSALHIS